MEMEDIDTKMKTICKSMPKLELHCHLNGCIPAETLANLSLQNESKGGVVSTVDWLKLKSNSGPTLSECFVMFKQIHSVIRNPEILRKITCDVVENFAKDNVIYMEIRSTPKQVHEIPSKTIYMESVISGIKECQERMSILVKLLISIDRERGEEEGIENVTLAIELFKKYPEIVVGVDLSGNPIKGNVDWILPLLSKARDSGLKITCHLPEVINLEETDRLLEFSPERFGHGLFLHPSFGGTDEHWEIMKRKRFPVEVCITSNLVTRVSESMEKHYVKHIHQDGFPFVICTDDSSVFNTSLSNEYIKFLQIVPKSLIQLKELCLDSVTYSFATNKEKAFLEETILKWWSDIGSTGDKFL